MLAPTSVSGLVRRAVLSLEPYAEPAHSCPVRLDRNENPYGPSPSVLKVLKDALVDVNRYPDRRDVEGLERAIAEYSNVSPQQVVISGGSDALIDLVVKTFIEPGDRVLVAAPSFVMYERAARVYGARVTKLRLRPGTFEMDPGALLEAARGAKLVLLGNPNNPTGNLLLTERVAEEVLSLGCVLVVDEAYYEYSGSTLASLISSYPNLVVLRTFSKAFGLAGLRVGYALTSKELADVMKRAKLPYDVSRLSVKAAAAALGDLEYVRWVVRVTREELRRVSEALATLGLSVYPSVANFLMFSTESAGVTSKELVEALLRRGIAIRDLSGLEGAGRWYARVSIGTPGENSRFLEALSEELGSVRGAAARSAGKR